VGLNSRTIRRYIAEGRITGYRVGPQLIRVDAAELDALASPIPTGGAA
jgi:excisionase family DNA binding protein